MARAANLSGIFEAFSVIPRLQEVENIRRRAAFVSFLCKKKDENQENPLQPTRRLAIGLTSLALFGTAGGIEVSHAEGNGIWIDGPLPVPTAKNSEHFSIFSDFAYVEMHQTMDQCLNVQFLNAEITNEDTGTRSFLKKGIYIANIGAKNRMHRLKRYAFDLLAMEDLIGPDTLMYVRRYLRYKSTFMYFDFDELITAAPVSDKQPLTDLANRLFDNFELVISVVILLEMNLHLGSESRHLFLFIFCLAAFGCSKEWELSSDPIGLPRYCCHSSRSHGPNGINLQVPVLLQMAVNFQGIPYFL